uniref:E3 ubiquitin-protein ligase TRIM39-like n=1 Tax=Labrus bergylta TaxID=56723 RepID=A0A3Q3G6U6_9LABR
MSAASWLLTEDQFLCSICLEVFDDPVTIPCGHNFCKKCITEHWKADAPCQCPNCKKDFNTKPELYVNTFIAEMAAQFRRSNLEDRMCERHGKTLEMFCKNDQMCVCLLCAVLDHKTHDVVPLKEEYEEKKAELGKKEVEIEQMIQKRRLKIQEIKHSVELSDENAEREMAEGVQVLTALKESVERSQVEFIDTIKEKQRKTEKQAEGFIKELEQEISELEKRSVDVEQLSRSEDHLELLQSFSSLNTSQSTKDWTEVRVHPPSYEGAVVRAVSQLKETLSKQMKMFEAELKRVQQYEVDVTLDPKTAGPYLILSDDGKQVKHGDEKKTIEDSPERFELCCVLAKQSFSTGRFYYEVEVEGKTDWDVGVNGYWTIFSLSLSSQPEKVGVFVDYEEGVVSFYDVDAAALIYSFTNCSFTEKLYPYFSPFLNNGGKNSAPLIISPVNQTE